MAPRSVRFWDCLVSKSGIGVLFVLLGEALLIESRRLFELAGLAFVIFYLVIVIYEEPVLRRKFGDSYQQYCDSVSRWVPRKPRGHSAPK